MRIFYKQRVTCEKNDVCATVTTDADFDRQIHLTIIELAMRVCVSACPPVCVGLNRLL